jgi:hypothetical protein
MSGPINSDAVNHGLNRDVGKYKDDRYVRCWNCGFICHLDRDPRVRRGTRVGDGITHPDVVEYNEEEVTYNGDDSSGWEYEPIPYDGYRNDFRVVAGCPLCGCMVYDQAP